MTNNDIGNLKIFKTLNNIELHKTHSVNAYKKSIRNEQLGLKHDELASGNMDKLVSIVDSNFMKYLKSHKNIPSEKYGLTITNSVAEGISINIHIDKNTAGSMDPLAMPYDVTQKFSDFIEHQKPLKVTVSRYFELKDINNPTEFYGNIKGYKVLF